MGYDGDYDRGYDRGYDREGYNGNPEPVFYTDNDKIQFMVTLPCHPDLKVSKSVPKSLVIINFMAEAKSQEDTKLLR